MEIKRTTEIFVETERRFVVHQPEHAEQIFCPNCAESMLTAEQVAVVFDISRRAVYQFIENGTAHFVETETGAVMICASSLAAILSNVGAKQISGTTGDKE